MTSVLNRVPRNLPQFDEFRVSSYFRSIPEGWQRERLLYMRQLLYETAGGLEEHVVRNILVYKRDGEPVFGLQIRQESISLLVTHRVDAIDPYGILLGAAVRNRWSVRFKEETEIEERPFRTFLFLADRAWRMERDVNRIVWEELMTSKW